MHSNTFKHTQVILNMYQFTCTSHNGNGGIVTFVGHGAIEKGLSLGSCTGVLLMPNEHFRGLGAFQEFRGVAYGAPTMHLSTHKVGSRLVPSGIGPRQPEVFPLLPDPHLAIAPTVALQKHLQVACRGQSSDKGVVGCKCLPNYSILKVAQGNICFSTTFFVLHKIQKIYFHYMLHIEW